MTRQEKYPDTPAFHYYNANPKNRMTGDCAFRAIATALDQDYNQTVLEMAQAMCKSGYALNDTKGIAYYLESKGWVKMPQPKKYDGTKFTGEEFCISVSAYLRHGIESSEGIKADKRMIANIGGHHIVAIIDGKVNDIWDSTYKCIGNYWIKRN